MTKQILLFDIDKTIWDSDKVIGFVRNKISIVSKISPEELSKVREKYIESLPNSIYFNPDDYIDLICKTFNFNNKKLLTDIYYGDKNKHIYSDCVYPGVFEVIEKLKDKFTFGIYSEGIDKFQNHKFKSMGISEYFDPDLIFIVPSKDTPEVVSKLPKGAIVVDDKERICEFLTNNGLMAIWLNRLDGRKSKRFKTIHSLLSLPQVLY